MLPSPSTYLQISPWAADALASRAHQHIARTHQVAAAGKDFATIAPQCIKNLAGAAARAPGSGSPGILRRPLEAVIHVELDRMGRHPKTSDFFHFQRDVPIDHVVRENAAAGEEFAVLVD